MDSHNKIIQQVANDVFSPMGFFQKGKIEDLVVMIVAIALFKLNFNHLHILVAHSVMSE